MSSEITDAMQLQAVLHYPLMGEPCSTSHSSGPQPFCFLRAPSIQHNKKKKKRKDKAQEVHSVGVCLLQRALHL
jgi:hypothetical protein